MFTVQALIKINHLWNLILKTVPYNTKQLVMFVRETTTTAVTISKFELIFWKQHKNIMNLEKQKIECNVKF